LRLFGSAAAIGLAAHRDWLAGVAGASSAQAPAGGAKIPVPAGGIIRSITGDIEPNSLAGGTLMHEHRPPGLF
jgi:hypothetical protein